MRKATRKTERPPSPDPNLPYVWIAGEWHLIMTDAQDEALVAKLEAECAMAVRYGGSELPNGSLGA